MKPLNRLQAMDDKSLRKELLTSPVNELVDLVVELINSRPAVEKVALTEEQFNEYFRIITRTGKRGRPSKKETYEILNGIKVPAAVRLKIKEEEDS